jgi:hypothetical protein
MLAAILFALLTLGSALDCALWHQLMDDPVVEKPTDLLGPNKSRFRLAVIGLNQDEITSLMSCECVRRPFDSRGQEHGSILAATWQCPQDLELVEFSSPTSAWSTPQWDELNIRLGGYADWAKPLETNNWLFQKLGNFYAAKLMPKAEYQAVALIKDPKIRLETMSNWSSREVATIDLWPNIDIDHILARSMRVHAAAAMKKRAYDQGYQDAQRDLTYQN